MPTSLETAIGHPEKAVLEVVTFGLIQFAHTSHTVYSSCAQTSFFYSNDERP